VITENIVTNLIKYGNLWADELIETLMSGVTIKEFKVKLFLFLKQMYLFVVTTKGLI